MTKSLSKTEIANRLASLGVSWSLIDNHLERVYKFANFAAGVEFVNGVAAIADEINHHPEITLNSKQVVVKLISHDIGGLSDKDFDLAKKIDLF